MPDFVSPTCRCKNSLSVKATPSAKGMFLNFKNLEERLLEELNRLRQLEPSVDKTLQSLAR